GAQEARPQGHARRSARPGAGGASSGKRQTPGARGASRDARRDPKKSRADLGRGIAEDRPGLLMDTVVQMASLVGIVALCAALGLSRATFYRLRHKALRGAPSVGQASL